MEGKVSERVSYFHVRRVDAGLRGVFQKHEAIREPRRKAEPRKDKVGKLHGAVRSVRPTVVVVVVVVVVGDDGNG